MAKIIDAAHLFKRPEPIELTEIAEHDWSFFNKVYGELLTQSDEARLWRENPNFAKAPIFVEEVKE